VNDPSVHAALEAAIGRSLQPFEQTPIAVAGVLRDKVADSLIFEVWREECLRRFKVVVPLLTGEFADDLARVLFDEAVETVLSPAWQHRVIADSREALQEACRALYGGVAVAEVVQDDADQPGI